MTARPRHTYQKRCTVDHVRSDGPCVEADHCYQCEGSAPCVHNQLLEELEQAERDLDFAATQLQLLLKDQPWGAYLGAILEDGQMKRILARAAR